MNINKVTVSWIALGVALIALVVIGFVFIGPEAGTRSYSYESDGSCKIASEPSVFPRSSARCLGFEDWEYWCPPGAEYGSPECDYNPDAGSGAGSNNGASR